MYAFLGFAIILSVGLIGEEALAKNIQPGTMPGTHTRLALGDARHHGKTSGLSENERRLTRRLSQMRNPTVNAPYYWAWHLFTQLNSPGQRRPTRGGRDVLWESWASDPETFPTCPDPNKPPTWPGSSFRTKVLRPNQSGISTEDDARPLTWYTLQDGVPTGVTLDNPEEVRRNRATFDYIVNNGLYYTEGLVGAFNNAAEAVEVAGGNTAQSMHAVLSVVDFPIDAVEMKADWVPLRQIPEEDRNDYYRNVAVIEDSDGNQSREEYGMVAMHIMTKDIPQWFWATWLNKKVLGRCDYYGCRDDFGVRPRFTPPNEGEPNFLYEPGELTDELKALMKRHRVAQVFQNYRLVGVQTAFTDPSGQPTIMGNTITEQVQTQTVSCITCHARAAIDSIGAVLGLFSDEAQSETPPVGDTAVGDNGAPDPTWFFNLDFEDGYFSSNTTVTGLTALQIDFVWGIQEAHSRSDCSSGE